MANNNMVESKHPWKAWIYLSPAIVLLLVFTVWPIINTLRMAFLENYSGLQAVGGVKFKFGIGNFTKVLKGRVTLT
ncbi:MAG: sugar ABC transporter permease, partial [Sphaerochaetaceae bacterium]|nr:sugar ABC transporter permease [Sphaerochaetaceae bacterium]